jgi:hypothetical protein
MRVNCPAALLVGLLGVGVGACTPPRETRFLNFDSETTAAALGTGWARWERDAAGNTFVWAIRSSAVLTLDSAAARSDRTIRFRAWPYQWDGAPTQRVSVFWNDAKLTDIAMKEGARVYTVDVPRTAWRRGPNALRFDFDWTSAPKEHQQSSDERTLAACFDWLDVIDK